MTTAALLDEQFLQLAFADQLEAVTYVARRTDDAGEEQDTEHAIDNAQPTQLDERKQNLGESGLSPAIRAWVIRKSDLAALSITPQEGDVIRETGGTEWTIRGITLRSMNTRYRFSCEQGRT